MRSQAGAWERGRGKIMEAIRVKQIMAEDGEIAVSGLPYKKGQSVEITVLPQLFNINRIPLTVRRFRQSGLIGMWKDHGDIQDSSVYARRLREHTQRRRQAERRERMRK
jgi:hypothetical protein